MKHQNKVLKIIKRILVAFSAIVLVIMIAALIMYHNEILTALSVKHISDEQAFTIELHGDMYFDDLMKTEINTNKELETFLYNKLSLNFYGKLVNKHGCSAFYAKTPDGDILLCNDIDKSISDELTLNILIERRKPSENNFLMPWKKLFHRHTGQI